MIFWRTVLCLIIRCHINHVLTNLHFFIHSQTFASPQIEISKSIITANSQSKITTEKGPVMLLYELFTDISFSCTQTIGPQHAKFKTQVTVNGCQFEGTGEWRCSSQKISESTTH